jgi:hypothetical protein
MRGEVLCGLLELFGFLEYLGLIMFLYYKVDSKNGKKKIDLLLKEKKKLVKMVVMLLKL